MRWGPEPPRLEKVSPFGTDIYVGPRGAGKSLLAAYRARFYWEGNKRREDGRCICGDISCDAKWQVFTNLISPTTPEYGSWCLPLDMAVDMLDQERNKRHMIYWIDEITQMFNARRAMMNETLSAINTVTMMRKDTAQLWGTGVSFDWLDPRIREMASTVYNCWTPNEGRTVIAKVWSLALGHLPPEKRKRPPKRRGWHTESAKKFYWHEEKINFAAELKSLRSEPVVYVQNDDGQMEPLNYQDLLWEEIAQFIERRIDLISVDDMRGVVQQKFGLEMPRPYVRDWLLSSGFQRTEDDQYRLMVKGVENAALVS